MGTGLENVTTSLCCGPAAGMSLLAEPLSTGLREGQCSTCHKLDGSRRQDHWNLSGLGGSCSKVQFTPGVKIQGKGWEVGLRTETSVVGAENVSEQLSNAGGGGFGVWFFMICRKKKVINDGLQRAKDWDFIPGESPRSFQRALILISKKHEINALPFHLPPANPFEKAYLSGLFCP